MKHSTFTKTKLAASLSLILGSTAATQVFAEEAVVVDSDVEVIEVTGMRSSIKESTRLKRDASGVVDAISAEDIGKFPDTNLAESLQRITGVSIDRSNGEGSRVTVRGFGPQFNMVTLNGRAMPASTIGNAAVGDTRAFDFQNLASDAVSSVEVYKTGRADIATGGMGASININTAKPLDNPGFKASVGGKALMDASVRDGVRDYSSKVTPEISGLLSWTDEEEVFGASINASFSERNSSSTGASVNAWNRRIYDKDKGLLREKDAAFSDDRGDYPASAVTGRPADGQAYFTPSNLAYALEDTLRERTNAQLTLQYRPIETLTATLDYTYSELDSQAYRTELSGWYDSDLGIANFTEGDNPTPATYVEFRNANQPRDVATKQMHENYNTQNDSIGLNLEWLVNDELTLVLDVHDSQSESKPTEAYGHNLVVGIGSNIHKKFGAEYTTSGLPNMIMEFDDCDDRISTEAGGQNAGMNCNEVFDLEDVGTTMMQTSFDNQVNEISQVRLDGLYEFEESSINFGIEARELTNNTISSNTGDQTMGGWSAANAGELLDTGFLDPINFNDALDDFKISNTGDSQTLQAFRGDAKQIGLWAEAKYNALQQAQLGYDPTDPDQVTMSRNPDESVNRTLKESIQAAYIQYNGEFELADMPVRLTAGLRYERTETTSTAFSAIPIRVRWDSNDDTRVVPGKFTEGESYGSKSDYDHFLPNFDISIDPTDDVIARFSYSKTIARPSYDQLSAQTEATGGPNALSVLDSQAYASASKGNPNLVPLESDNIDLSVEWYFQETSYVSVGYYTKDVSNFIGTEPKIDTFFGLRDVTAGPRAQQALADLAAQGIAIDSTSVFAMVAANEANLPYNDRGPEQWALDVDINPNDDDPLMQFRYDEPVNTESAKIDGWELAVQHFFGESGFGFQANYTIVNGDIGFDLNADSAQFALEGLSDTANVVLMFEKYDFSARLAYNWRDEFLAQANRGSGEPVFTEAYQQLDLSIGYQVTDELSVSFAGINLTGEDIRQFGRNKNQFVFGEESDARYELGARYTF
jgi:TonB-dependent receptor